MDNLFFNTEYTTLTALLVKVVVFTSISALLLYLIYLFLVKTIFRKSLHDRTTTLRLSFLWAIFVYFIVFNVYIAIFVYQNGIDAFQWTSLKFYLGILAQLLIYVSLITLFFVKRHLYKKRMIN